MPSSAPPLFALPFLPNPLAGLPAALNHILEREPWAKEQLRAHAGKSLVLRAPPFELRFAITPDGLVRLAEADAAPSVSIELPLSTVGQVIAQGPRAALSQVKLDGDAAFAQTVSNVAQNVRWDVEEDLSHLVGDVAARRLTTTVAGMAREARAAAGKLGDNLAEYFLEENRQLVRPREVDAHAELVRALRDDLARLEKRIERLGRR